MNSDWPTELVLVQLQECPQWDCKTLTFIKMRLTRARQAHYGPRSSTTGPTAAFESHGNVSSCYRSTLWTMCHPGMLNCTGLNHPLVSSCVLPTSQRKGDCGHSQFSACFVLPREGG